MINLDWKVVMSCLGTTEWEERRSVIIHQGNYNSIEILLPEKADCNEAIWCRLVTGHTTVTIGVVGAYILVPT